jgi:indole-3-glycerol phosphate synthase
MAEIDVGAIVPSTRDLLQVVSTRRKSLALLAEVGPDRPDEEAARLYDINISAFAFAEAGEAMKLGARSTKTVPSLCLLPATDRNACLAARYYGADAVCIDALMPQEDWDQLAKIARTMRMLSLALVTRAEGVEAAMKAGARAMLLRASSAAEVVALAGSVPRTVVLVAEVIGADGGALRELARHVDAAIVPASVHTAKGFAGLVAELDP